MDIFEWVNSFKITLTGGYAIATVLLWGVTLLSLAANIFSWILNRLPLRKEKVQKMNK